MGVGIAVGGGAGVNVGSEVGLGVAVGIAAIAARRRASTVASMSGLGLVSGVGMAALTAAATAASISMAGPEIAVGAEPVQAHAMDPKRNSPARKKSLPITGLCQWFHRIVGHRFGHSIPGWNGVASSPRESSVATDQRPCQ